MYYLEKHGSYGGTGIGQRDLARFCGSRKNSIQTAEKKALQKIRALISDIGPRNAG